MNKEKLRPGARKDKCQKGHLMAVTRETTSLGKTRCSVCYKARLEAQKPKLFEYMRNYREKNKQRLADHKRLKTYGIGPEEYYAMLAQQQERCKICNEKQTKKLLDVDHDHATGLVRGLLCTKCNTALGLFNDSEDLLGRAREYLIFSKYATRRS